MHDRVVTYARVGVEMLAVLILTCHAAAGQAQSQPQRATASASKPVPWKAGNAVLFLTNGLAVDADGAPNSYLVDGNGLSYTCDGVEAIVDNKPLPPQRDPKSAQCNAAWAQAKASNDYSHLTIFGFLTDSHNHPVVQAAGDPLPGKAYISTTSMIVPGTPEGTQRHWVDATKIPYIVLPSWFRSAPRVKIGDLAVVYWPKLDKYAFAVYADGGPGLGEASVKVHVDLGSKPLVTRGGLSRAKAGIGGTILTVLFPGVNVPGSVDADDWNRRISDTGKATLAKWGGLDRLKACAGGDSNLCKAGDSGAVPGR